MMHEYCDLFLQIPRDEIDRVFRNSNTAGADMDYTFMGFEDVYKAVTLFVPKDRTIIDLGCAYASQSYYFKHYKKYIAVDIKEPDVHFRTKNMEFYEMSIQDFCQKVINEKWNLDECFAICSYVPDDEAREMVRKTFPHCLVYYPQRGE